MKPCATEHVHPSRRTIIAATAPQYVKTAAIASIEPANALRAAMDIAAKNVSP